MTLSLTQPAIQWFKNNMEAASGDAIRFFVRLGGHGAVQSGFSLGVNKQQPNERAIATTHDGIEFFVEEDDAWFFNEQDLHVKYSRKTDEVVFELVNHQQ